MELETISRPKEETEGTDSNAMKNELQKEVQNLRLQIRKLQRRPSRWVAFLLLLIGGSALGVSILYSHLILAFIGLGLMFSGSLLTYITPTAYAKEELISSSSLSALRAMDRIIQELGYRGKAVYIPPRSLREFTSSKAFIQADYDQDNWNNLSQEDLPSAEDHEDGLSFYRDPKGMSITPPGEQLMELYSKELGVDFARVDLDFLQLKLPDLLINDLELVEDLEIDVNDSVVNIKMFGRGAELCDAVRSSTLLDEYIGCPIHSSFALAISRASGKAVILESVKPNGKGIESTYRLQEIASTKSYCVKCRQERELMDLKHVVMKNGRRALKGTCSHCKSGIYRIRGN